MGGGYSRRAVQRNIRAAVVYIATEHYTSYDSHTLANHTHDAHTRAQYRGKHRRCSGAYTHTLSPIVAVVSPLFCLLSL